MSYAKAVSTPTERSPVVFKPLPAERILFIIDSYALTEFDIDFSPSNLDSMSSFAIILRAYRFFALQKNRYQKHSYGICVLTSRSFNLVMDFTSNINIVIEKLTSLLVTYNECEEVIAYDFNPLIKYVTSLRNLYKDGIFRVVMAYNRDECLPLVEPLNPVTYSVFCSPTFYFDTIYICNTNIETDEMAQTIYAKLALMCSAWSFKICSQRKPVAIMNGITSLLPHPYTRSLFSK